MFRKILIRAFLAGACLFGILILSVVVAGYLAFQPPSFYAQLRDQDGVDPALATQMEAQTRDFEAWARASAAKATRNVSSHESGDASSPALTVSDTFRFDVTDEQINSLFASDRYNIGDVRNPRVKILDGQLLVGAELFEGDSCLVFSIDLKPQVNANGSLCLELTSARLGMLPFPLHTVLKPLSSYVNSDPKFQLDVSGDSPVVTINALNRGRKSPIIKSIHCTEGNIAIEFQAPSPAQHSENRLSIEKRSRPKPISG